MNARTYAVETEFDHFDARREKLEQRQAMLDTAYAAREDAIRHDLEELSEAFQDLDCLSWRRERDFLKSDGTPGWHRRRVTTGQAALLAFTAGDALEFFRLVKAGVDAVIAEKARDEVDQEHDS